MAWGDTRGHAGTGDDWTAPGQSAWASDYSGQPKYEWNINANATPATKSWWSGLAPYTYSKTQASEQGYSPDWGSGGTSYFPNAYYGRASLNEIIAKFQQAEAERLGLNNWSETQGGYTGDVGKVYTGSAIGSFSQYPGVDNEIQSAAQAYGIPVNFLKAIIAHESSGDWSNNNYVNTTARPEMGELLPYVGVFKVAADSRGLTDLYNQARNGNRGAQINLLAAVLRSQAADVLKQNPTYGWLNVAAYHYSGDPSGNSTPSDSYQYGTAKDYMANVESWWKLMDTEAGNLWSNTIGSTSSGGPTQGSSLGGDWASVDQWNNQIADAIAKVQQETGVAVPANVIKAIMKIESNGDANVGVSPAGYGGLMQTGPGSMGGPWSMDQLLDPGFAIYTGAKELALRYLDSGKLPWDNVAVGYFSGHYYPNGASDSYNSDYNYQAMFQNNMSALGAGTGTIGGGATGGGSGGQIGSIWGNAGIPNISQEFGPTEWSLGDGAYMYDYGSSYGVSGHPGIDYSMDIGGMLYSPVSGVVELAGGTPYYTDERYGATDHTGEFLIRMDNGDELILGHMSYIGVNVGDRITAGQYVGKSGTNNGGHVHVEYRTPDPSMEAGWRIVDPRLYLNGQGGSTPVVTTTGNAPRNAMSYMEMVRAIATGRPVYTEGGLSDDTLGSGWRGYLRNFALGRELGVQVGQSITNAANNALNGVLQGSSSIKGQNISDLPVTGVGAGIVQKAMTFIGYPYIWATAGPSSFDCSGFTSYVYKQLGYNFSTGSHEQYNEAGRFINPAQGLQAGDLLFFDTANGSEISGGNAASHVGMYIGNGQMIHAANPSVGVIVSSISDPYYANIFLGAKRVI